MRIAIEKHHNEIFDFLLNQISVIDYIKNTDERFSFLFSFCLSSNNNVALNILIGNKLLSHIKINTTTLYYINNNNKKNIIDLIKKDRIKLESGINILFTKTLINSKNTASFILYNIEEVRKILRKHPIIYKKINKLVINIKLNNF